MRVKREDRIIRHSRMIARGKGGAAREITGSKRLEPSRPKVSETTLGGSRGFGGCRGGHPQGRRSRTERRRRRHLHYSLFTIHFYFLPRVSIAPQREYNDFGRGVRGLGISRGGRSPKAAEPQIKSPAVVSRQKRSECRVYRMRRLDLQFFFGLSEKFQLFSTKKEYTVLQFTIICGIFIIT